MFDTLLKVALGFYLGRTFYLEFNKQQALRKEREVKEKITSFLQKHGLSIAEAKAKTDAFMQNQRGRR